MGNLWCVTYQYHSKNEAFSINTELVEADSIGEALKLVTDPLEEEFEKNEWSDYHVTSINIITELH